MKLFGDIISEKNKNFDSIQLTYSCLCPGPWFCRIWAKDWISKISTDKKEMGESYGKTKFEAYRLALKDLNIKK